MSLLFCHDHKFVRDENGRHYSYGQFDPAFFDHWASVVGSPITIAARHQALPPNADLNQLTLCDTEMVRFVDMPNLSKPQYLVGFGKGLRDLERLVSEAERIVVSLPGEIGLHAAAFAGRQGKPYAVEVAACVSDSLLLQKGLKPKLYAPLAAARMRSAVKSADVALYVTKAFLQERYPTDGAGFGVSNVILPEENVEAVISRIAAKPLGEDVLLGIMTPLFHAGKGLDVLLRALQITGEKGERPRLEVAGFGDPAPWREMAAELGVADQVTFLGALRSGDEVMRWLDRIDVYVLASRQEGLPRSLVEAMARGCASLTSTVGGTPELIEPEFRHDIGDADRLAAQISALAASPDQRRAHAISCARRADLYRPRQLNGLRQGYYQAVKALAP